MKILKNILKKEEIIGKKINIDANNFLYQTDKEILAKIDKFMKNI